MNGIELLGATLLHFLWEGILIAAVYAIARQFVKSPEVRYVLACVVLAGMALAPVATWVVLRPVTATALGTEALAFSAYASPIFGGDTARFFAMGYEPVSSVRLWWVTAIWGAGVVVFLARLLGGWLLAQRLRRKQVRAAPPRWQQVFDGLRARLRVSRPVRLLVSGLAQAPAVVGVLRPVVLVPVGALAGLPTEQMEALLLHELAHIRRYDHILNAVQSMIEALLFYHPAVWWVSGHMRAERELCCDDAVVAITGDVSSYARALVEIGGAGNAYPMVAATGGSLANRVARLLGQPRQASRMHSPAAATAGALVAIAVVAALAQTARPQFEVASIKPGTLPEGASAYSSIRPRAGGRFEASAPVRMLIQAAYDLQPFQLAGGPNWIGSDQYEVNAKATDKADRATMLVMLQSLLEDRFQLRFHRESRELPIYALTVARGGLKLPTPQEGSCIDEANLAGPLVVPGTRMPPPSPGTTPQSPCGSIGVSLGVGGARIRGSKVPMAKFASELSRVLGRTVTDRTAFSGTFDVDLNFLPDDTTGVLPPPPPGAEVSSPPIFEAVQQYGLRLESTKGPVEVVVIDHVERPSAN